MNMKETLKELTDKFSYEVAEKVKQYLEENASKCVTAFKTSSGDYCSKMDILVQNGTISVEIIYSLKKGTIDNYICSIKIKSFPGIMDKIKVTNLYMGDLILYAPPEIKKITIVK